MTKITKITKTTKTTNATRAQNKPRIERVIVVEGKYDKIKLDSLFDADIVVTDGFGIFSDREKQAYIKKLAENRKLLTATDSDGAGLVIRGFLNGLIPQSRIDHILIPPVPGKEKRKSTPSKEGTLGLEGIDADTLRALLAPYIVSEGGPPRVTGDPISNVDLYEDGLIGADGASELRRLLEVELHLPTNLSTSSLIKAINSLGGRETYENALRAVNNSLCKNKRI